MKCPFLLVAKKKALALKNYKKELLKTGGGPPPKEPTLSWTDLQMLNLFGETPAFQGIITENEGETLLFSKDELVTYCKLKKC